MITTPLIKESEKQPAHFSRRILGIALLAFVLLGCFAFSSMSKEEAVGEPDDKESTVAIAETAVGEGRFNTIGMELEFHQCLTANNLGYDSLLYTSKSKLADGSPLFKIVAETKRKTEVVTGVINGASQPDMKKLRDWIRVGKELSLGVPATGRQAATTLAKLGRQFDSGAGTVAQDPGPALTDPLEWKAKSSWSPQLTAQGAPEPHLSMMKYACDPRQTSITPPQTEDTPIKKLTWIIQTEMCQGVARFLKDPRISETKEAICFLPKATNIATVLERGGESFADWCKAANPDLAAIERSGPGFDNRPGKKFKYDQTVANLLAWADGTTKTTTLGYDSNFPVASDDDLRIEYRRAENFFVLQQTITGGSIAAKAELGFYVVEALFQGCIPKFNQINNVKTYCNLADIVIE